MKLSSLEVDFSFWGVIKALFYFVAVLIGSAIDYIQVERVLVYTLTSLMIMDWITGVLKAWRLGLDVTSKKSNKGIIEKMVLLIIPIAIAATMRAIGFDMGITVRAIFSMLTVAELYSLIGNCYAIYSGKDQKEFDAVSAIIKLIRSSMINLIKKFLKDNQ